MTPRLLDLFCGAGGAAMGYSRAGFEVVGVDIALQPNYPFEFIQADALDFPLDGFDVIHASPPCQAHSTIGKQSRLRHGGLEHVDLVAETREALQATGRLYVIENVPGAPLIDPVVICGSALGLDLRRHRLFESNAPLLVPPCVHGWQTPRFRLLDKRRKLTSVIPVDGGGQIEPLATVVGVHGHINYTGEQELRKKAMGIDWMNAYELTQAIPPVYTELIGYQLIQQLQKAAA